MALRQSRYQYRISGWGECYTPADCDWSIVAHVPQLELKEIAAMAEPYYVTVSPHNYNSTTAGLAATLQVSACMPNFLITEYCVNFEPRGQEVAAEPFPVENGSIALLEGPGLGMKLRPEIFARHP